MDPKPDLFISYTRQDRSWAEWIAWVLEEAGYRTVLQAWDFRKAQNFVLAMQQGAVESTRTLAVLTPEYFKSAFTKSEWAAAFASDPASEQGKLVAVRVADFEPPGMFRAINYIDLVGLPDGEAERELRTAIASITSGTRAKPAQKPAFPGEQRSPSRTPGAPGDPNVEPSRPASVPPSGTSHESRTSRSAGGVLDHFKRSLKARRDVDLLLHTFFGLGPTLCQPGELDFATVYHLWADASGSSIAVKLEQREELGKPSRYFSVCFHNAERTYPGNVAFRPGGMRALDNGFSASGPGVAGMRYLRFEARLPVRGAQEDLEAVALGFRVVDRLGTHWMWRGGNRVHVIASPVWETATIDLAEEGWDVFHPDGNHRYPGERPDFSVIVAVVIEFGRDDGSKSRPGWGSRTIHVRDFALSTTPGGSPGMGSSCPVGKSPVAVA